MSTTKNNCRRAIVIPSKINPYLHLPVVDGPSSELALGGFWIDCSCGWIMPLEAGDKTSTSVMDFQTQESVMGFQTQELAWIYWYDHHLSTVIDVDSKLFGLS